jgi:hypothetical protein
MASYSRLCGQVLGTYRLRPITIRDRGHVLDAIRRHDREAPTFLPISSTLPDMAVEQSPHYASLISLPYEGVYADSCTRRVAE